MMWDRSLVLIGPTNIERSIDISICESSVPDSKIFLRTTTVRHFLKGAGDWDTEYFKSGIVEPNMDGQLSHYGGSRPEQPLQNLIAVRFFLIKI